MSILPIDTNIIIRIITQDNQELASEAVELVQRIEAGEVTALIPSMIIAECVWVLQGVYEFEPSAIAEVLKAFIVAPGIITPELDIVLEALDNYASKNVDFIDAYLAAYSKANGHNQVVTWNAKHFKRLGVTPLRPRDVE